MLFLFLAVFFKLLSVHGKTASYLWQTFKLTFWNVFFIPSLKFFSISCLSTGFSSYFHTGYLPVPRYTHWFFQWFVLFLAGLLAGFSASHWIIPLETDWHFFTDKKTGLNQAQPLDFTGFLLTCPYYNTGIRHIPEKHFKMIRYGGIYARHREIDKKLHRAMSRSRGRRSSA